VPLLRPYQRVSHTSCRHTVHFSRRQFYSNWEPNVWSIVCAVGALSHFPTPAAGHRGKMPLPWPYWWRHPSNIFVAGGPLPARAPRGRRGEVQQSGGASPSSDSLACLCRARILRAVRDQSRHCGVSAAETDPDRCGAAKGPRGKQR
jgi:hypothetical protein